MREDQSAIYLNIGEFKMGLKRGRVLLCKFHPFEVLTEEVRAAFFIGLAAKFGELLGKLAGSLGELEVLAFEEHNTPVRMLRQNVNIAGVFG